MGRGGCVHGRPAAADAGGWNALVRPAARQLYANFRAHGPCPWLRQAQCAGGTGATRGTGTVVARGHRPGGLGRCGRPARKRRRGGQGGTVRGQCIEVGVAQPRGGGGHLPTLVGAMLVVLPLHERRAQMTGVLAGQHRQHGLLAAAGRPVAVGASLHPQCVVAGLGEPAAALGRARPRVRERPRCAQVVARDGLGRPVGQRAHGVGRVVRGVLRKVGGADHEHVGHVPALQVAVDHAGARVLAHYRAAGVVRGLELRHHVGPLSRQRHRLLAAHGAADGFGPRRGVARHAQVVVGKVEVHAQQRQAPGVAESRVHVQVIAARRHGTAVHVEHHGVVVVPCHGSFNSRPKAGVPGGTGWNSIGRPCDLVSPMKAPPT